MSLESAKDNVETEMEWLDRKLREAKGYGFNRMHLVEEAHGKCRSTLDELEENPLHFEAVPTLALLIKEKREQIERDLGDLKTAADKDALDDEKAYIARRLADGKQHGARFLDRVAGEHEKAEGKLREIEAHPTFSLVEPSLAEWVAAQRETMRADYQKFQLEKLGGELETGFAAVKRKLTHARSIIPRQNEAGEKEVQSALQILEAIDAKPEYGGFALAEDFVAVHKPQAKRLLKDIRNSILEGEIKRGTRNPLDALRSAAATVAKVGLDGGRATGDFERAQQGDLAVQKQHPEWLDTPAYAAYQLKYQAGCDEFKRLFDEAAVKEEAKGVLSHINVLFCSVDKHNIPKALDALNAVEAKLAEVQADTRLMSLVKIQTAVADSTAKHAEQKAAFQRKMTDEEYKKATTAAMTALSHASSYSGSDHESQALQYYNEAKDRLDDVLGNPQFAGHPKMARFLEEFHAKATAFEKKVTEKILAKEKKEVFGRADTCLKHARTYLASGHESQALAYLEEAKAAAAAVRTGPLAAAAGADESLEQFGAGAAAFEKEFLDRMAAGEKRRAVDRMKTAAANAKSHLDSSEGQALSYKTEAVTHLREIESNPDWLDDADVAAAVQAAKAAIDEFTQIFNERLVGKKFKDLTGTANMELLTAESELKASRYGMCMQKLNDGRGRAAEALSDAMLREVAGEKLAAFEEEFNAKAAELAATCNDEMVENHFKRMTENVKNPMSSAKQSLDGCDHQTALRRLQEAADASDVMRADAWLISAKGEPKIEEALRPHDDERTAVRERLSEELLGKDLDRCVDTARQLLSNANSCLDRENTSQALDQFSQAKAALGSLAGDPRFAGLQKTAAAVEAFREEAKRFSERFDTKGTETRVKTARAAVADNANRAETYFASHHHGRALEYARVAGNLLLDHKADPDLMKAEGAWQFVEASEARLCKFRVEFAEAALGDDVKRAAAQCAQLRAFVAQALAAGNAERALLALREARRFAETVGTDEKFEGVAAIDEALAAFTEGLRQDAAAVGEMAEQQRVKSLRTAVSDLLKVCRTYFEGHQQARGLDYLGQTRQKLAELQADERQDAKEAFAALSQQVGETSDKFEKKLLADRVKLATNAVDSAMDDAEFQAKARQHSRAMQAVAGAKQAAAELGSPEFAGLAEVDKFFEDWLCRVSRFESDVGRSLTAEQVKKATDAVGAKLFEAEVFVQQSLLDRALAAMKETDAALKDLQRDPEIGSTAGVKEFAAATKPKLETMRRDVSKTFYAQELNQTITNAANLISAAENLFSNFAEAAALAKYGEARTAVEALAQDERFRDNEKAKSAVAELSQRLDLFSSKFAEQVLAREASSAVSSFRRHFDAMAGLRKRGIDDGDGIRAVLAELGRALGEVEAGPHKGLLLKCAEVSAAAQEARDARKAYAEKCYGDKVHRTVEAAQRVLDGPVKTSLSRGLKGHAVAAFKDEVAQPIRLLTSDEQHASFMRLVPALAAFVAKADVFAETELGIPDRAAAGKPGGGKKGKSKAAGDKIPGDPRTLEDWFGAKATDAKHPTIALSVDINPSLFKEVKDMNANAARCMTVTREAVREMEDMPFNEPATIQNLSDPDDLFVGGDGIAGIERCQAEGKKILRIASKGTKEDDPTLLQMKENFATWNDQVTGLVDHWRGMSKAGLGVCEVLQQTAGLKKILKEVTSLRAGIRMEQPMSEGRNSMIPTGVPNNLYDYEILARVADQTDKLKKKIESSLIDGKYPMLAQRMKELKDLKEKAITGQAKRNYEVILSYGPHYTGTETAKAKTAYMNGLRRFPKTREWLRDEMKRRWDLFVECRSDVPRDESLEKLRKLLVIPDPFEGKEQSDAFEEDMDLIVPFTLVTAGTPGPGGAPLPPAGRPDQFSSNKATEVLKENAGRIVFSAGPIPPMVSSSSDFAGKFDANGTIYGRAVWPHALANYAVGVEKKTNKPLYPPAKFNSRSKHGCFLLVELKVDGKVLERDWQENCVRYRLKPAVDDLPDYYAKTQSIGIRFGAEQAEGNHSFDWSFISSRLRRAYKSCSAGTHEVEVNLRFQITSTDDNLEYLGTGASQFPFFDSNISEPIASGKFTVDVQDPQNVRMPRVFEPRAEDVGVGRTAAADLEREAVAALERADDWGNRRSKTEIPIHASLQSNWHVIDTAYFDAAVDSDGDVVVREEPVQYGVSFWTYFHRKKDNCWNRECVAAFLVVLGGARKRNPPMSTPFWSTGASGPHEVFDVNVLPDEELAKLKRDEQ
ncbi:hypothetical protein DIPPA_31958 [Diplonema papillatum]|nr:hypothetical protein DIPPA_31958 [Diplonema papillatum]